MLTSFNNLLSIIFKSTDVLPQDTWAKVLPQDIWIEIASYLSPQDLENFKQACKTFMQIGQSVRISKVSHDLLYNRLRKLDPSLPQSLPAVGFLHQYQNDFKQVIAKMNSEIAYLRKHHPELVRRYIDNLLLDDLAPLQRLEKISNTLDDLNNQIIIPFINIDFTILNLDAIAITRIPRKLIQDECYRSFWRNLDTLSCSRNHLIAMNLQGLVALERLYCQGNQLTALNVQGLVALKRLDCSSNQLTALDVQGLVALEWLNCSFNPLIALDVQGLGALEKLYCQVNQLTALNVQGLDALKWLDCSENQLTALNVQGLDALKWLDCSSNQLTALDVQGLVALGWLDCGKNQLTALNVQGLVVLKILDCRRNHLTALNVQGLVALEWLYCDHNQLSTLSNESVSKFGERWARDTLATQAKPALPTTNMVSVAPATAPTLPLTPMLNQRNSKRKRTISAREAQELNSDADEFLNLKTKKSKFS